MPVDYKNDYREFYMLKNKPEIVGALPLNFLAVCSRGDSDAEDGEYKIALGLLYGIAFTIKMSRLDGHKIDGYFDYVVPPLEGLWRQNGVAGVDYAHKESYQ